MEHLTVLSILLLHRIVCVTDKTVACPLANRPDPLAEWTKGPLLIKVQALRPSVHSTHFIRECIK